MLPLFRILTLCFLVSVACAGLRAGDHVVVKKKNGALIEGEVLKDTPSELQVKTRFGTIKINRVDILSVEKGVSPLTQYKTQRKAIKDTDAAALIALARWCEEQNLEREALEVYQEAREVAGPHYIEAQMLLADYAMRIKEYRLAVLTYSDLAQRLKHAKAYDALRKAEDRLRKERLELWKRAEALFAEAHYADAVTAYGQALQRTVRATTTIPGDVGRDQIAGQLLLARQKSLDRLRERVRGADLISTDKPRISWVYRARPGNLRGQATDVSIRDLCIDLEMYVGGWLAVKGAYRKTSMWDGANARAITIDTREHPEVAVAAYTDKSIHQQMLDRRRNDVYLEELIRDYPYGEVASHMSTLAPGQEVVCYGRLRRRQTVAPQYVFEVWAMESVADPEAQLLAENLKKSLRCKFDDTPLASALEFVNLVTGTEVEFDGGDLPDVSITLTVNGRPAGFVISQIASECGLAWTRKGARVLMKKTLTQEETAIRDQVIRLASDNAKR